ncbi:MAG: recombinase family protein, partial [Selenomonadaceae bacterium]|nr:recombinase family protein [Selenomonadaceae bacterium]
EFNTLEAQRESGENYVKSQMHQGWQVIEKHYDDGGYSGGTLKRPALQELLQDVENGEVNMIVVYKIDRLTRSLIDFAKLVEVLDRNQCSFVSVTQNFNTYDSMGRLTLNVLLSFAQFEREVITERIRDKVDASKKKGMWMGGNVPLGYDAINKKLVINEEEAPIIKLAFEKYLVLRSEVAVASWLNNNGYTTMSKGNNGRFTHIRVSSMLRNVIYIGKITHKDKIYDGQHEAIIAEDLFESVQKIKDKNRAGRLAPSRFIEHALLKGLIECDCCHAAMVSTKSNKHNKIYEYYTSVRAVKEGYKNCRVGNVPAGEMDNFVLNQLADIIKSPKILGGLIDEAKIQRPDISDIQIINKLSDSKDFIHRVSPTVQRQLIEFFIQKVRVNTDRIKIIYTDTAIELMDDEMRDKLFPNNIDGKENEIMFHVELHKKRGSVKIFAPETYKPDLYNPLYLALIKAFKWQELMKTEHIIIEEVAEREKLSREYVGKIMKMTYLAPDIVAAIVDGSYPKTLSVNKIVESEIPLLWTEQRLKYGFTD